LQLGSVSNLKDTLPLALAVAGGENDFADVNATTRAFAILVAGQFGDPRDAKKLEPLLSDTRVCMPMQAIQPNQQIPSIQVRDVALCVMLQLTNQKPADYGYLHARLPPQRIFDIRTLHVANDQVRAEAAAKWKTWSDSDEGQKSLKAVKPENEGRRVNSGEISN
jgi:hypothetical protein